MREDKKSLKKLQWSFFLSATVGYGLYYVCRLSLNVVKKPLVDDDIFTENELGLIGSALFFSYAVGKFVNGFLADRANIKRFMATGLIVSSLINITLGFSHTFWIFVILWGANGWGQSMECQVVWSVYPVGLPIKKEVPIMDSLAPVIILVKR